MRFLRTFLLWATAALYAFLCGGCTQDKEVAFGFVEEKGMPAQEFLDSMTLTNFGNERKFWELKTTHLVKYRESGEISLDPVAINYFDEHGNVTSWLKGDSGGASARMDTLTASGHVLIRSQTGKRLETEWIQWTRPDDRIYSDRFVRFTTEDGDVMTGTGFSSNSSLSEWRIHNNVKAEIKNTKDVLE